MSKYGLIDIVDADGSLSGEQRLEYHSLAALYEKDFDSNLSRNSLELSKSTGNDNPIQWQKFLNHPSVKMFIDNYLYEIAEKQAQKVLKDAPKDANAAMKVREMIDKKKKKEDNSHIYVMLLPQKDLE